MHFVTSILFYIFHYSEAAGKPRKVWHGPGLHPLEPLFCVAVKQGTVSTW